jgi:hypothetical protein
MKIITLDEAYAKWCLRQKTIYTKNVGFGSWVDMLKTVGYIIY